MKPPLTTLFDKGDSYNSLDTYNKYFGMYNKSFLNVLAIPMETIICMNREINT